MNRRDFVMGMAAAIGASIVRADENQKCEVLDTEYVKNYPDIVHLAITRPGSYCLDRDWSQRKIWGVYFDRSKSDMLRIYCGHVKVDMKGHTLACNFERSGIFLDAIQNRESYRGGFSPGGNPALKYSEDAMDNRFVTLCNGTIDLTGGERTGIGCYLRDAWGGAHFTNPYGDLRPRRASPDNYTRNEYLLENLKIYTLDIGVLLEGSHNVIRNCVIHASGQAAIACAGPHLTIENCEIWLKPSSGEQHVSKKLPRAAIHLRDGSNAIIRNNVIRISEAEGDKPSAILIRDGAGDVLIENNTFVNVAGEPIVLGDNSQALIRHNKTEARWTLW
jgi:hypothetical protein